MALLLKFKYYIGIIFGAVVALGVAYLSGKSKAESEAVIENKDKEIANNQKAADAEIKATTVAKETTASVSRSSPSDVDKQLSDRYTRD